MIEVIRQLYNLNRIELRKLRKQYSDERLLECRTFFIIHKISTPVVNLHLYYYIDNHGDFLHRGRKTHYTIARAIFNSLSDQNKIDILGYIDECQN